MIRFLNIIIYLVFISQNSFADNVKSQNEQRVEFSDLIPDSRVVINLPSQISIRPEKQTRLIVYALPNGNSIEQTEGKSISSGDDWHFDIQHIAAQVRFLRKYDTNHNYVVAYLESYYKSWPAYSANYGNSGALFIKLVDTIQKITYKLSTGKLPISRQKIILSGHSGGGKFIFNYINSITFIPSRIEKIVVLDANYAFENLFHTKKLSDWVKKGRFLMVSSYIDSTVILNGKRIVSSKGGTGWKSFEMLKAFESDGIKFSKLRDTSFFTAISKDKNIVIRVKENPDGKIYHTILVERNGLIDAIFYGNSRFAKKYKFWGPRAYSDFVK